nr:cytochrome b6/f subunit L [Ginkgo biloba]
MFTPTITSYFGFLLASFISTLALFIGLSRIRLIQNEEKVIKRKTFRFVLDSDDFVISLNANSESLEFIANLGYYPV